MTYDEYLLQKTFKERLDRKDGEPIVLLSRLHEEDFCGIIIEDPNGTSLSECDFKHIFIKPSG